MHKSSFFASIAFALFLSTTQAQAGGGGGGFGNIVHDPTSYVKHVESAAKAAIAEGQRANAYLLQLNQWENELLQRLPLDFAGIAPQLEQARSALNLYKSYQSTLVNLNGSIGNVRNRLNLRFDEARLLNMDFNQYAQREGQHLQARNVERLAIAEQDMSVIQGLQNDYSAVQAMQSKIASTVGTHESMGLMNSQMNQLVATMVTVKGQLATSSLQQQKQQTDDDLKREAERLRRLKNIDRHEGVKERASDFYSYPTN
ncbi:hypothetical protein [Limnobacter alexandrii]|uniref:hypothetical protein n=1 Tax=Limnobacter alexandrii TaxID=2570352 RepID=UPI0011087DD3|nr:hypothetical protein [Limnobacter alexandrii]